MALPEKIDHVSIGLSRVLSQFSESVTLLEILTIYLERFQELEEVFFQLLDERGIYVAEGEQLDVIGSLFNIERDGLSDPVYRQRLLAEVSIGSGSATIEEIREVLTILTESESVKIFEYPSAHIYAHISGFASNLDAVSLQEATAAGVSSRLMWDNEVQTFIPAEGFFSEFNLALENDDLLVVEENGDPVDYTLLIDGSEVVPVGTSSYLPHTLDTELINPLCHVLEPKDYQISLGAIVDDTATFIGFDTGEAKGYQEISLN